MNRAEYVVGVYITLALPFGLSLVFRVLTSTFDVEWDQWDEVQQGLLNRRESSFKPNIFSLSKPRSLPATFKWNQHFQETVCWKSQEVKSSLRGKTSIQHPCPGPNSFGEQASSLALVSSLRNCGTSGNFPDGLWSLRSLANEKCLHPPRHLVSIAGK